MRLAIAAAVLIAIGAQRAPVMQSVDLVVPTAPVTFKEAGRTQLVHELHVTNFLAVDVSIAAVRVTSAIDGRLLAEYRGEDLGRAIVRPGLRHDHKTPHVVGPGMRAVVNFWIALPGDARVPQSVVHSVDWTSSGHPGSFTRPSRAERRPFRRSRRSRWTLLCAAVPGWPSTIRC